MFEYTLTLFACDPVYSSVLTPMHNFTSFGTSSEARKVRICMSIYTLKITISLMWLLLTGTQVVKCDWTHGKMLGKQY